MTDTGQTPRRDWGKAFDRFFPWIVASALGVAGFSGRFQLTEAQAAGTAGEVASLKSELKDVRGEIVDLKIAIGRLTTALEYVGGQTQAAEDRAPRRPARQFDH